MWRKTLLFVPLAVHEVRRIGPFPDGGRCASNRERVSLIALVKPFANLLGGCECEPRRETSHPSAEFARLTTCLVVPAARDLLGRRILPPRAGYRNGRRSFESDPGSESDRRAKRRTLSGAAGSTRATFNRFVAVSCGADLVPGLRRSCPCRR